jgi:hypothetical protein
MTNLLSFTTKIRVVYFQKLIVTWKAYFHKPCKSDRHYKCVGMRTFVATPLLEECENDTHTPEMETWESSGTPKISKFDCRGQNTSP